MLGLTVILALVLLTYVYQKVRPETPQPSLSVPKKRWSYDYCQSILERHVIGSNTARSKYLRQFRSCVFYRYGSDTLHLVLQW